MAQQTIGTGSAANDGTGDPIRTAFTKVNANFTELYAREEFTSADHTKLDGIEALADVTDATNVAAAGAVMTTDSDASGYSFVVDEDDMASDSAVLIPTQQSVKAYVDANGGGGGLADVVDDTTPQLGGNLDVNGNSIVSVSNGNIAITPDGTGAVVLDGLSWPTSDGTNGEVLSTDGAGNLSWAAAVVGTVDFISNVATSTIIGRATAGSGNSEELTPAQVRTLINVEDGADVTDATNVDAAGATMNTDTDVSGNSWVLDEDDMTSNSATKVPTQQSVKAYVDANAGGGSQPFELIVAVSDETTDLTTGTAKVTFRMPDAVTLTAVRASVTTAPTGSTLTVDINEGGASILSTKLTIDAGAKTSTTAATPAVISDSSLADDAEMTIDIDQIGSSVAGAGLKVTLIGTRT